MADQPIPAPVANPAPVTTVVPQKPWWTSMTIWAAGFVGFLQTVPDLVASLNNAIPSLHLATNPIVIQVLSVIGVIVAIYGRLTAKSTIA